MTHLKKIATLSVLVAAPILLTVVVAQQSQPNMILDLTGGGRAVIAIPDMRGSGAAQPFMGDFNATLFSDIQDSGTLKMAPKSMYPLRVPQQPSDFKPPAAPGAEPQGPWLTDWSMPPVEADYLTVGYTAVQGDSIVLQGWLYNVKQPNLTNAQVFGKLYYGSIDAAGARKIAHQFAADILDKFGATSLAGSKIYFTREMSRTVKEIWAMEYDGSNQHQVTRLGGIAINPAISPDGTKMAFAFSDRDGWSIRMMSLETGRYLTFLRQGASVNETPAFTPDGKKLLYASTAAGGSPNIYICNVDGTELRPLARSRAIEVEPTVNPKTGAELLFTSGRSGPQQVYKMNMEGADVVRLTPGEGEAGNAVWHPDGQHIAFTWTRGFASGHFNIFIMDIASGKMEQLTHDEGRNENPGWSPDGRHLAFSSNRDGGMQIWTMLANGTQVHKLTTQGVNTRPVWAR